MCVGMTDPSAAEQDVPPPKPPRPSATQRQLEADELYARQLAEHYNRRAPQSRLEGGHPYDRSRRDSELSDDREYSFFEGIVIHLRGIFLWLLMVANGCRRSSGDP